MKPTLYTLLARDRSALLRSYEELVRERSNISREIQETLNQGSETWHDNAPFEALVEQEKKNNQLLDSYASILASSVIAPHREPINGAGIGHKVTLDTHKGPEAFTFVGDWHLSDHYETRTITPKSAIGQSIQGKIVGQTCSIQLPAGTYGWKILEITPLEPNTDPL
jgi:transcription elongation GreA/GreB family factor